MQFHLVRERGKYHCDESTLPVLKKSGARHFATALSNKKQNLTTVFLSFFQLWLRSEEYVTSNGGHPHLGSMQNKRICKLYHILQFTGRGHWNSRQVGMHWSKHVGIKYIFMSEYCNIIYFSNYPCLWGTFLLKWKVIYLKC